ncbi:MAG: cbb3-type cytochrome c oxidase subunit 3 [Bacteroidota bacterium]
MFSKYLTAIENVSVFPIIGLLVFFPIFVGIVFWVIKKDKPYMEKLANIPFQENDQVTINEENKNEK